MPGLVPPVADEREALLGYLAQKRYELRLTTYGVSDEDVRKTPSASSLSLGGIIKHVSRTERWWMTVVQGGPLPGAEDGQQAYSDAFVVRPGETLESILAEYDETAAITAAIVEAIEDLGRPVPVPRTATWFPEDVEAWSVRWVLLHILQETARHAGHADIVRESLDGATAFPLMAAAEEWNVPWLEAWTPTRR